MVGIIIASHGEFAEGILQSGSMIFGEQENVEAVVLSPSEGPNDLRAKLDRAVESIGEEEILFLVDLWGGSPFNQANLIHEARPETSAIVTGLNLPMLLEAYGARFGMNTAHEIATHIVGEAKNGVRVKPESLEPEVPEAASVEPKNAGSLPPGTVIGDGKLKISLARVDSRLLHGQVSTAWTKAVNPTRIIVVSDAVAQDKLRKTLITEAAPPGVKANVIPVEKLVEIAKDTRFGGTRALLLFENPEDVVRAVEGGVEIKEVNVGSMAHSEGKKMINNVLSVDKDDVVAFNKLKEKGIEFDVRKVPSDSSQNLFELLRKASVL